MSVVLLLTSTEFFEDFEAILYEFFYFPYEIRLKIHSKIYEKSIVN